MIKISQAQYAAAVNRLLGREKVADALARAAKLDPSLMKAVAARAGGSTSTLRSALANAPLQRDVIMAGGRPLTTPLAEHHRYMKGIQNPLIAPKTMTAPNLPGGAARLPGVDTSGLYPKPTTQASSPGVMSRLQSLFGRRAA